VHARLLTFTGNDRIDDVLFLWEATVVILRAQAGFCGVAAGIDRKAKTATILSLWASEEDLVASDAAMLERREAAMVRSGATMQVEQFEQVSEVIAKAPAPGSALMLNRFTVAPPAMEESLHYLEQELLSGLLAQSGFCAMRTLFDRRTGRGVTGLSWDDPAAMEAGEEVLRQKMSAAAAPGLHLEDSHRIEIQVVEMDRLEP
jgi:hypothetical protein